LSPGRHRKKKFLRERGEVHPYSRKNRYTKRKKGKKRYDFTF